jgi:hypothetical protein
MKRLLIILLTVGLLGGVVPFTTTACHAPVTITTPQGQVTYTANEVAKRVESLQATTIKAEEGKLIPTDVARLIIKFTVSAAKTLKETPNGWGQTVAIAWAETKMQIPLKYLNEPVIQVAVMAVDTALSLWIPAPGGVQ